MVGVLLLLGADELASFYDGCKRKALSIVLAHAGGKFDRTHACFDSSASLVVRIVDTCQCTYAPNFYSNKRW